MPKEVDAAKQEPKLNADLKVDQELLDFASICVESIYLVAHDYQSIIHKEVKELDEKDSLQHILPGTSHFPISFIFALPVVLPLFLVATRSSQNRISSSPLFH